MMELRSPYKRKKSSRKAKAGAVAVLYPTNDGKKWNAQEDSLLRDGVCRFGGKKWKAISELIEGRSPGECSKRWNKLQSLGTVIKRPWSREEDTQMMELVERYGASKWAVIASHLQGRNGKQCRERWHNQLNPKIKKSAWTERENEIILQMQAQFGNCWAKITAQLPGRTDNAVKNHWHSSLKSLAKGAQVVSSFSRGRVVTTRKKSSKKKSRKAKPRRVNDLEEALPKSIAEMGAFAAEDTVLEAFASPAGPSQVGVFAECGPLSPSSVENVDSLDLLPYGTSYEDSVQRAQAVIDNILDPMGMSSCSTSNFDLVNTPDIYCYGSADDDTETRCMDTSTFDYESNSEMSPTDPTSPAQPPFGLDELLYDSLHGVCDDSRLSGLVLSAPLGEVARVYQRSMVTTEWGTCITYSSPLAPTFAPSAPYVAPNLSPITSFDDMAVFAKEEPSSFDTVKLEIPSVECGFTQATPDCGLFSSQLRLMDM